MFSIITPSLNQGRFLKDCIQSVAGQTSVKEHLVLDGKSTDGSHEVLSEQIRFLKNVRWIRSIDSSQSDALNKLVESATGEWVGWLNADEMYLDKALDLVVERLSNTDADVVYGECIRRTETLNEDHYLSSYPFSLTLLKKYGCYIPSSSFFVRLEILNQLTKPVFNQDLEYIMDWELYLRISSITKRFEFIPRPLSIFHVHSEQKTNAKNQLAASIERNRLRQDLNLNKKHLDPNGLIAHRLRKIIYGSYLRQIKFKFSNTLS